ncbi:MULTISPECIES: FadR/GntR family transcriptional regulator [Streptomyces]|uniref:GntR family transcriptional regulator n=2 Tax=Streptomyces TaxID=1883 RepID=A0A2U9P9U0_STRAS|nr:MULTISPECIES: GntR family transcriptional regulator [Streptomyces]AWT46476.1 GntR family transcriptional regulator [Streptomyces actuosus]MBM4823180.1 GntR family transcriptional regulator [Streptomyces actuosus]GHF44057.1 GntR family transcriptional regulator [Streptomyces griseosporeus]
MEPTDGGARRAIFAPVDNLARVEAVVHRLGDAIELGLLADGEQLPGESELAGLLGVSTVTLREALMALRQQGLVTTRRGRGGGSFVSQPAVPAEERLKARLRGWSTEELRDLGDHWAALSGAAARLAADRTAPEDLRPLRRTVEELTRAGDAAARSRVYGRFHVELAAAAQSARLTREQVTLQTEIGALPCLVLSDDAYREEVAERQRAVISAVQDGAHDSAGALAERCVRESTARLIAVRLAL